MQKRNILLASIAATALTLGIAGCTTQQKPMQSTKSLAAGATAITAPAGVKVVQIEGSNDIILVMPSDIHFTPGSAALNPAFQNTLNSVANIMKDYPFTVAEIPAHTDSVGSTKYNMRLSILRSQAVVNYLVSQGISVNRLVPVPYGESKPLSSNATNAGRAMNRSVQIILHTPPTTSIDGIPPVQGNKK